MLVSDQQMPVTEPRTQKETAMRPPLPPFTRETAIQKVRLAEDAWNSRDPEKVALAYTIDSRWRNRAEFPNGRQEIVDFLKRKWTKELDYRLIKRALGLHREPHRGSFRIRMARRLRELVSFLRQ
jgi:nuclear transport factor 2 (NTF2) superfamily protein